MGSGAKEPPWGLEGSTRARSGLGRRQASGSARARGRLPEPCWMGTPGPGSEGQGELRPAALGSRTKPARAGPGYSQQEAHVGGGGGWGASAVSWPPGGGGGDGSSGGQGRRGREKRGGEEDEGKGRLLDGHNLLGFARSSGRRRGRKWETHRLNHGRRRGRRRRRGKGRKPAPRRTAAAAAELLTAPPPFSSSSLSSSSSWPSSLSDALAPRGPHPASSRESSARPPSSSRGCGSAKFWTSSKPGTAPNEGAGATRPAKSGPPSWGSWLSASNSLAGFQQSGREWASSLGCLGLR